MARNRSRILSNRLAKPEGQMHHKGHIFQCNSNKCLVESYAIVSLTLADLENGVRHD